MENMTSTQLERLYRCLYERYTTGNGYQAFGYDWQTLRTLRPGLYTIMRNILAILETRNA